MLAFPEYYFESGSDRRLRGHLGPTLRLIIRQGLVGSATKSYLTQACSKARLFTMEYRTGDGRIVVITPPDELVALVASLGVTRAARRFQAEVEQAAAQIVSTDRAKRQRQLVRAIIAQLRVEGGLELLKQMRDALIQEIGD